MSEQPAKAMSVFNTPLECGLRSACLLLAAFPKSCDLQRLVQYDYLVVHSGDVDGGPPSIHPATPNRSGELLVRRSLVEQGLEFMVERRVVERSFSPRGFMYSAGEYAAVFFDAVKAHYIVQLRHRADWVVQQFQQMSDEDLSAYMQARWLHWGAEFVRESLLEMTEE